MRRDLPRGDLRAALAAAGVFALLVGGCDAGTPTTSPPAGGPAPRAGATSGAALTGGGSAEATMASEGTDAAGSSPPRRGLDPHWGDLLDAAMLGPVELPDGTTDQLRALQLAAGNRPVLAGREDWPDVVAAVLDALGELEAHGLVPREAELRLADDLDALRETLVAFGPWSGDEAHDLDGARAAVHLEYALVALFLSLAERHDVAGEAGLETARGARARFLAALATWDDTAALVDSLPPASAPYDRLRAALPRYRRVVADGGFEAVPATARSLTPGRRGAAVLALKTRLAQEDPAGAGTGDVWDDALTDALRRARAAYQLPAPRQTKGLVDKALLEQLGRPAEARLAAIERNLARLRRSDLRRHDYAVYVNLPDYHGEVWDGPERRLRFRTVIGNTTRSGGRMINATPSLTARIDRVVFNPWWNVPPRIYKHELLKAAESFAAERAQAATAGATLPADAPSTYWEAKGYDVKNADDPETTWVRRQPGPGNALGKVKFLFENRYFVFLHDTPQRKKFRSVRRAFSHGCMRVQDPILLAEELLKRDGTWRVAEDAKVMAHYRETPIELQAPVWVVVDYITARADDVGRVHFFPDDYRRDAEEVAAR